MNKNLLLFILILCLISCRSSLVLPDYFGQSYPTSTPIVFAPDLVSIEGRLEHGISFTPDYQELAFGTLHKDDGSGEIYYSHKSKNKWTEPRVFEPLKEKNVFLPYFTPDGKTLLYAQSNPDYIGGYITDIWSLDKVNGVWSLPTKLEAPLNSTSREASACMTYDRTIYFSSNRNCDGKENCFTADLFYSKNIDSYHDAEAIPEFLSPNDEESIFISPKEDYIMFCRYTDDTSYVDLYISYRDHMGKWTTPQNLDSSINTKDWERRPFVSIDNAFLFFTRLQIGETGLTESDIYWVNTSKVFKPFVFHPIADITVQVGQKLELNVPRDHFKDIDDTNLTIRSNTNQIGWLKFDSENMKLSGTPTQTGDFELILTAVDKYSNSVQHKVRITVK